MTWAQQGWSIVGTMQTIHGELPDRRILVALQFRGNFIATTYSDSEGKFSFSELSANAYHIIIEDESYRLVDQIADINPMLTSPTLVRVTLDPRDLPGGRGSRQPNNNLVNSVEFTTKIPKPAFKAFKKALKADKESRTNDAISDYEKAVKLAPNFYAARNNLGSAYLSEARFPAAEEQFQQVIKMNPSDATAYFNLGNVQLLTNRYKDAQHTIQEGLDKQPNSALGMFLIGSVLAATRHAPEAETTFHHALELDPSLAKAHLGLVNVYLQQGQSANAVEQLKQFLKAAPNDSFAPGARDLLRRLEQSQSTKVRNR